jgi:2-polyprenyl-6-methoxyphenol hydroxylase-like FAD-dependent oxidoreductase
MGLLPRLKSEGYLIQEIRFVDRNGKRIAGLGADAIRAGVGQHFLSIPRGDLASCIYDTIKGKTEVIYDDSINAIEQCDARVRVTFERGAPREFDLLVGADGLHSVVRHIAFGNGSSEKRLGYYAASFIIDRYPRSNEAVYVCYSTPGKQIARYALRGDRTAFLFVFEAHAQFDTEDLHSSDRKKLLRHIFAEEGWECADVLAALDSCEAFYFVRVSQVRLGRWSSGRVALIGDAAFCPSLLAGEGACLAMTAAYFLAGELKSAGGDHRVAFQRYETAFRPLIERKQRSAERFAKWFAPRTRVGIHVRNMTTRLMSVPALARWLLGGMISDRLALPDYSVR